MYVCVDVYILLVFVLFFFNITVKVGPAHTVVFTCFVAD